MKLTEKELNSYRIAVWNLLCSLDQGWTDYKQKIRELKQIDKQLFDAMHSDGEGCIKFNNCFYNKICTGRKCLSYTRRR